jgi:catechol 2,3-dioxygenase-like lactoylglutathione lyase family enzyme
MTDDSAPMLDQVNLVVRDMAAAVDFYRRLGLDIPDAGEWQGHHRSARLPGVGGLDLELDSTAFAPQWDQGWPPDTAGVVVGFRLPDRDAVDRTYADLTAAGHRGQQPPYDAFWGSRYAIVEDPDGNAVGLMGPMDRARRAAPPPPPAS